MIVHVLSQKSNGRLRAVFLNERHIQIVHKIDQPL